MIAFRDETAARLGLDLRVHINPKASRTVSIRSRTARPCTPTCGRRRGQAGARSLRLRRRVRRRAPRRGEVAREGAHRVAALGTAPLGPKRQRPGFRSLYNARKRKGESLRVFPISNWTGADIWRYIQLHDIPIVPLYFAKERPVVERDGALIGRRRTPAAARRRSAADAQGALSHARLLSADGRDRQRRDLARRHPAGDARDTHVRTARTTDRQRFGRFDGKKKQEGYF